MFSATEEKEMLFWVDKIFRIILKAPSCNAHRVLSSLADEFPECNSELVNQNLDLIDRLTKILARMYAVRKIDVMVDIYSTRNYFIWKSVITSDTILDCIVEYIEECAISNLDIELFSKIVSVLEMDTIGISVDLSYSSNIRYFGWYIKKDINTNMNTNINMNTKLRKMDEDD